MRFERLELTRYGGYEGRVVDFGRDGPDLHLIIGPNEAGKSTLLSAIGDLLFGVHRPTLQDWRFESKDLRLAATIASEAGALRVIRRSGLKNTLLDPDGAPLPEETLATLLGGLDRPAFDRLYGLDHARLRAGGKAILEGKDDAAQSLFEAGTGMAAVGARLKQLETECGELFKPSASKPRLNQLLRERLEATDALRAATIGEADWTRLRDRRGRAAAARDELITEDQTLAVRLHHLERLARARAPLRRLTDARGETIALGPQPPLPLDAVETLGKARADRATAIELKGSHQRKLDRALGDINAITVPEVILTAAPRIDAVEAERPEIDRMRKDLPGKAASLDAIDSALAAVRETAGLDPAARLPSSAWRRRARKLLEDRRALLTRARIHSEAKRENEAERLETEEALDAVPEPAGLADLREVVAALSPEVIAHVGSLGAASSRAARKADEAMAALGWIGSAEALAVTVLPSIAEVAAHEDRDRRAKETLDKAMADAEAAQTEAARLRTRLAGLVEGGPLPTAGVVAAARERRDLAMRDVADRLARARQPDDVAVAGRLAFAISEADLLVDRRDTVSGQIAEHALHSASLARAKDDGEAAERAAIEAHKAIDAARADWAVARAAAGLPATLVPAGFPDWREARDRALGLREEAEIAAEGRRHAQLALEAADGRLSAALTRGDAGAEGDIVARLRAGKDALGRMEARSRARIGLVARAEGLERGRVTLGREAAAIERQTQEMDEQSARLLAEEGIGQQAIEGLEDILDALDDASKSEGAKPGLTRDVEGMRRDIGAFEHKAVVLLADLCRPSDGGVSHAVRRLATELTEARATRQRLTSLRETVAEEEGAIAEVEVRLTDAQTAIDRLRALAGVDTEEELDSVLILTARATAAVAAEASALVELTGIAPDAEPDTLAATVRELDQAQAEAERESIEARRREITADREDLAAELKEVMLEVDRAGIETAAADAQQSIVEARAALASGAERFIEAAAATAVLRWLVERHRAGAQAPLLARAGSLFSTVTQGSFQGLALDYGDEDRPRIVATRSDGARIGVEGLSEGTRDQLFLALRLGALQARAGQGAPPLTCDDLLVTSDDARAGAVLRVLRETAERLQVLVFTHHDHIEDVARRTLGDGDFRVHRLGAVDGT